LLIGDEKYNPLPVPDAEVPVLVYDSSIEISPVTVLLFIKVAIIGLKAVVEDFNISGVVNVQAPFAVTPFACFNLGR